jgi:putative addiction module CopG family antidote
MTVAIPPEYEGFVESVVTSGTYHDPAEVVGEALRLLKRREELRRDVNAGIDQLEQGRGIEGEVVFERLAKKADAMAPHQTGQDA